ncbi:IclR family transcriptional regulator [Aquabacter sp. CN5-332]|uniref:IclR family transcriptional regulator n=1 Tax=Aquabacter sp. CN5-332 TaxID=3156608 RepID=UPI0032B5D9DE
MEAEFSLSTSRALRILSSFSEDRPELGVSEIARELSLSKASTSRFLQALEMHGFVDRNPVTRKFRPGVEAFRVGSLFLRAGGLNEAAAPIMARLVAETGFTSYLSSLRGDTMVILAALEGRGPIKYSIPVGEKLPVHTSATGHAALSTLKPDQAESILRASQLVARTPFTLTEVDRLMERLAQVRAQGFSLNWQEHTAGVASVAAAAVGTEGELLGVLSLGYATMQASQEESQALGREVRKAADELSAALKARRPHEHD